jgi:3-hydroxyacyl-[acyl-carrier-protein] dehydratase
MRYFLIDRVLELECDKKIVAIKNVSLSEDVFNDHFFGNPVMPGALQIEAIAQAATVLIEVSSRFTKKAVPIIIHGAKFRELVIPGDQMRLTLEVISSDGNTTQVDAIVSVSDKVVTSAKMTFSLQPIDKFYPPSARHMVILLYRNFLKGAKLTGVELPGEQS